MPRTLRKKLPIHDTEADTLARLQTPGSPESMALEALTGITITPHTSEAKTLHAVFAAGLELVEQKALEEAYRREAEYARTHPDVQAWRRAMNGRHLRSPLTTQDSKDA
jgi:hypothetical protein